MPKRRKGVLEGQKGGGGFRSSGKLVASFVWRQLWMVLSAGQTRVLPLARHKILFQILHLFHEGAGRLSMEMLQFSRHERWNWFSVLDLVRSYRCFPQIKFGWNFCQFLSFECFSAVSFENSKASVMIGCLKLWWNKCAKYLQKLAR